MAAEEVRGRGSGAVSVAPGRRSVLTLWRHDATDGPSCRRREAVLRERLRRLYRPFLGPGLTVNVRSIPGVGCTVGLVDESGDRAHLADLVVWGDPIGAQGPATPAELRAATREAGARRRLLGSFVVVQLSTDGLTAFTSSDLLHTLKHASGPAGEAWATQGLAALVATGRRPTVVTERIPEFVFYDFVFGDDELLDGVRVLPEASVIRLDRFGAAEASYWPVRDRLQGGSGDARSLRTVLGDTVSRLTDRSGIYLALTAGRDSTLLASCLAEAGRGLPCFTIGAATSPDGAGAAAVARQLGWPHYFVGQQRGGRPSVQRLLDAMRWTEGQDTGWNFYPPPLDYRELPATALLFGVGGEMGRAFFWASWPEELRRSDPAVAMSDWNAASIAPAGGAALRTRARMFSEQLQAEGWTGTGVVDAWHARGRVRKWPARTPPPPGVGLVTAYTAAPVARTLLGIPPDDRAAHRSFDLAASLGGDLHRLAQRAAAALPAPRGWRRSRRAQRLGHRLRLPVGVRLARSCLRELGCPHPSAVELFGADWWQAQVSAAPFEHTAWRYLWNLIAVEALQQVSHQVAAEQAAVRG